MPSVRQYDLLPVLTRALPVPSLPSSNVADRRHDLPCHAPSSDHLVPGNLLLTQRKNGISALQLSREIGVSYNAAWRLTHKLLQVMFERSQEEKLVGRIEIDEPTWAVNARESEGAALSTSSPLSLPCKPLERGIHSVCSYAV